MVAGACLREVKTQPRMERLGESMMSDDNETWKNFIIRISGTYGIQANATAPIVRGQYMKFEDAVTMASDAVHLAMAEKPVQIPIDNTERIRNVVTLLTGFVLHAHDPESLDQDALKSFVRVSQNLTTLCEDVVNNRVAPDGTDSPNDAPVKGEGR